MRSQIGSNDMKYAIVLTPLVPVRNEASERSEMVTQLVFGDLMTIVSTEGDWVEVLNSFDNYRGWVSGKMLTALSKDEYEELKSSKPALVRLPLVDIKEKKQNMPIRVSIGASLPGYNYETEQMRVADRVFTIRTMSVYKTEKTFIKDILRTASYFINTPYLWGGKSIMGVDCSGFVQIVYRVHNIDLPRDASQQISYGKVIDKFEDIRPGDLAFFHNEKGSVVHVGIVYTPKQIIHSSGNVHIDKLTPDGIWSEELDKYTHTGLVFKRLVD